MASYDFDKLRSGSDAILREGGSTDDILEFLRSSGASPVASMKVISDLLRVTVTDAKIIVLNSQTWASELASIERFHDEIEQAIADDNELDH